MFERQSQIEPGELRSRAIKIVKSAEDRGDLCVMVVVMPLYCGRRLKAWCIRMSRTACCAAWPQIAPCLGHERGVGGP